MVNRICVLLFLVIMIGCKNNDQSDKPKSTDTALDTASSVGPKYDADLAYTYIEKQLSFGPRVPGTPAQLEMANWMEKEVAQLMDTVFRQETTLTLGDGKTKVPCINIIGSINPSATRRILLLAHWDTRPWADRDMENRDQPIMGADDGASGVGVLLALAKAIKDQPLTNNIGVDILFTDVEDYAKDGWGDNSYALGAKYWAQNPHIPGYTAEAGILLDMVGAANARFPIEMFSQQYARNVITDVWEAADQIGFGNYFVYEYGNGISDDHIPINEIAGIPTIDIIHLPKESTSGFVSHWHTHNDNINIIDKNTLNAVGQTLIQYLYTR